MTEAQAKIIMAYAGGGMSIRAASEKVFMHETTVAYHLNVIQGQTARNPRKFFDLCYLVGIAAQILGGKHENE